MPRAKKPPTFIKSLRVDLELKEFLEQQENANEFVIQLIKSDEKYQKFLREIIEKRNENQPKLFNDDF